jgi:hypothetical protein
MSVGDNALSTLRWEDLRRDSSDPVIPDLPFPPSIDEMMLKSGVEKVLSAVYPKAKANRAAR